MKALAWFAVLVWAAIILLGLNVAELAKLRAFDPQQKLMLQSMSVDFDSQLRSVLQARIGPLPNTVVHIRSEHCFCETLVSGHSDLLSQQLATNGFKNLTVTVAELPQLARYAPSTPAVAVFNASQQLMYFGPYALGLGCLTNNSLVDSITRISRAVYRGAQINSEVKGCFCPT